MVFVPPARRDLEGPALAVKFAAALIAQRKCERPPDPSSWAREFQKLIARVPFARVQRVLSWYCVNLNGEFVPWAYSAQKFRQKFPQIEECMKRTLERDVPTADPLSRTTISAEAQRAADRLAQKEWPAEVGPALPALVQLSRERFAAFGSKLRALHAVTTCERDRDFLQHVGELHLYAEFVEDEWLEFVHLRIGRFAHYSGNPMKLVFNPASKVFHQSFWRAWAMTWAGSWNAGAFDHLLKTLNDGEG